MQIGSIIPCIAEQRASFCRLYVLFEVLNTRFFSVLFALAKDCVSRKIAGAVNHSNESIAVVVITLTVFIKGRDSVRVVSDARSAVASVVMMSL